MLLRQMLLLMRDVARDLNDALPSDVARVDARCCAVARRRALRYYTPEGNEARRVDASGYQQCCRAARHAPR